MTLPADAPATIDPLTGNVSVLRFERVSVVTSKRVDESVVMRDKVDDEAVSVVMITLGLEDTAIVEKEREGLGVDLGP